MRLPVLRGVIDRRLLVNYRVDPALLARLLPAPFRPALVGGHGVAGICLIRLARIRPRWLPAWCGVGSENAAHRVAVEWDEHGARREGVFILRRDTGSRLNAWLGGRVFPGVHGRARFVSEEDAERVAVRVTTVAGAPLVTVRGRVADQLPVDSIFPSLAAASDFFAAGSLGWSPSRRPGQLDGLRLASATWSVHPLAVDAVESAWLDDASLFPAGSARYDCTLLMRGIAHEWHAEPARACAACAA